MEKKRKSMAAFAMVFVILSGCGSEIVYSSGSAATSGSAAVSGGVSAYGLSGNSSSAVKEESGKNAATGGEAEQPETGAEVKGRMEDTALSGVSDRSGGTDTICVYICGEIADPGVYHLKEGARVYEAIEAAGGLLEGADTTHTNQARVLADGEQITILTEEEAAKLPAAASATTAPGSAGSNTGGETGGLVNINTADAKELTTLSGIGETRAEAIIAYRTKNGAFRSIEDIMKVTGIGASLFEKIKDSITVG